MGVLRWSYQQLDEKLRRCFAYCSIFPRRHRLERDELVNLWVAEGFIDATNAGQMEAVGKEYFRELVSTSFLQLGEKDSNKGKEYFLVHDLLHDLAEQVAGSDCFRIENGCTGEVPLDVRHLFVETCDGSVITKKIAELEKLRTLIIHTGENDIKIEEVFEEMFKNERLRKLRVLVVKTTCREDFSFPASIDHLKHLRYLAFRTRWLCRIDLPDAFNKLYNKQVVDFGDCVNLVFSSDRDMIKLINLRHVIIERALNFPYIGCLTSLETLPFFLVRTDKHGYGLEQLGYLDKLRGNLEIQGLDDVKSKEKALEAKLAAKKGLRELALTWNCDEEWFCADPDEQAEVFEGLCPPERLEVLEIKYYNGERYPDWMVGHLKCLERLQLLVLQGCSPLGAIPQHSPFFSDLLQLTFYQCHWGALPDNMEHLQSLEALIICECRNIRSLGELPKSLKYFELSKCDRRFMKSCETRGNPNWEKIQHIPRTDIGLLSLQDLEEHYYAYGYEDYHEEDCDNDMEEDTEDVIPMLSDLDIHPPLKDY